MENGLHLSGAQLSKLGSSRDAQDIPCSVLDQNLGDSLPPVKAQYHSDKSDEMTETKWLGLMMGRTTTLKVDGNGLEEEEVEEEEEEEEEVEEEVEEEEEEEEEME